VISRKEEVSEVTDRGGKSNVCLALKPVKPLMCFTKEDGQVLNPSTGKGDHFPCRIVRGLPGGSGIWRCVMPSAEQWYSTSRALSGMRKQRSSGAFKNQHLLFLASVEETAESKDRRTLVVLVRGPRPIKMLSHPTAGCPYTVLYLRLFSCSCQPLSCFLTTL